MRQKREKNKRDQDGIYKRADSPYWWASWPRSSGGTCRRSTGIKVVDDPRGHQAKRVRAAMMSDMDAAPEAATNNRRTFGDLIEAYMDGPGTQKAPRTQRRIGHNIKPLLLKFHGWALVDIRGADVRAYIKLREEAGIKPGTIRNEIDLMAAMTNWANRELEWDIPNPWQGRKPKADPPRTRFLSKDEAGRLIEAAEALAQKWPSRCAYLPGFVRLCLYTGMRPGEALGLEWSRVDLDRNLIHFGVGDQKSKRAESIPINQTARVAILACERTRVGDYVLAHPDGRPLVLISKGFEIACQMAGLVDVHPHDLRRTFGSWLAQEGVPIQRISRLMRHSSIEITHRVYAHLMPSDLADASAVLDQSPRLRVVK